MTANRSKSTKRSVQKSPSAPPEFFVDRSLGSRTVVDTLRTKGVTVHAHDDYFPVDAPDEEWLTEVGQKGWFVLTKDEMIQRRIAEREALISADIGAFVLLAKDANGEEMASAFIEALDAMLKFIKHNDRPFICKVYRDSSLKRIDLAKLPRTRRRRSEDT